MVPEVMTPAEALMWAVERDPILRSTFLTVTVLDAPPEMDRLRRRMADAIGGFPRMHQRVRSQSAPWDRPAWIDDASFDLDYHIRHLALPAPADDRALFDLAGLWLEDAFDPVRPLWQLTVVEGLAGGRAALLVKMHHTITDGVGGLRLSSSFLDLDREGKVPVRPPSDGATRPAPAGPSTAERLRQAAYSLRPSATVANARRAIATVGSLGRQAAVSGQSGSSLWRGRRSMSRRLDRIDLDLDEIRRAAKALGGTINDLFVAGVAGGAAEYHRRRGVEVEQLRASVPISTRVDRSFGGNAFVPARVVLAAGERDPEVRFRSVHEALAATRDEPALGLTESLAGVLLALPPALLTPLARQQVSTVDFAASNLRGSPVQLFVAGAAVEANYPMGPTAGVAFNATVLSYMSRLDLGLDMDTAAIDDPDGLRRCLEAGLHELIAFG
ncbi:MAG TPA: wax ester/triacylglycerol synthase domain-containing protein [Acidimicrobiales bacterium]|nr:wax ester/triacylglycerol synthase domain-containing protein [Acidimicrobiales bacterium]